MPWHTIKKQDPGTVPTPKSGFSRLFPGLDGIFRSKNDDGTVRPLVDQAAHDLATSGSELVAIDGSGSPNVGDVLVATAGSPSPAATWQPPSNLQIVDMENVPVIDDTDSPFTAVIGTCIPVDLASQVSDVIINLPSAQLNIDREIWVAIISAVGSYKVNINPSGSDTVDEFGIGVGWDMVSDYETAKFRAVDLGGGSYMWKIF